MIGPWFYAATFVIILFGLLPLASFVVLTMVAASVGGTITDSASPVLLAGAYLLNALLAIWVWRSSSSPALSFWDGLKTISARSMSGCANITLIYIYPLLLFAYLTAAYHTLRGLSRGPDYPRVEWIRQVIPDLRSRSSPPPAQHLTTGESPTVGGPTATLKKCPYCAEMIKVDAIFCRYCGHDTRVPVPPTPPARRPT